MQSYWERFRRQRVARRRILTTGAGLSLGAVALATLGCGGDDDTTGGGAASPTRPTSAGGATTPPVGATAGAQSSGTVNPDLYGNSASSDPPKMGGTYGDTYTSSNSLNILTNASEYAAFGGQYVYDHLITYPHQPQCSLRPRGSRVPRAAGRSHLDLQAA